MTSNNNQILPPSNIWSHFISGRLNPVANVMPLVPPNWMFPYLPINKQQQHQFESLPNPYSLETLQMFRTMVNRRNQIQQNVISPNNLPKNNCMIPAAFGLQKPVEFFLTRSPGSSNITSPIDQGFGSNTESTSNFENVDGQKSDISSTRCPVCNQIIVEFELDSHLHQELGALMQNSKICKEENSVKHSSNTSPISNEYELKYDLIRLSSPQSQISHQNSLNRYKNFEKIKLNRHQRKNTLLIHQNAHMDPAHDRQQYSSRPVGNKNHKNNSLDCSIGSKRRKISENSDESIDIKGGTRVEK